MHLFLLSHTGFGLNTNILETNVLNLGIVIYFVIAIVGRAFNESIMERRERLVKAVSRAEEKYKATQETFKKKIWENQRLGFRIFQMSCRSRLGIKKLGVLMNREAEDELRRIIKSENQRRMVFSRLGTADLESRLQEQLFATIPPKLEKRLNNGLILNNINNVIIKRYKFADYPQKDFL